MPSNLGSKQTLNKLKAARKATRRAFHDFNSSIKALHSKKPSADDFLRILVRIR